MAYHPRRFANSPLYRLFQDHWETFLSVYEEQFQHQQGALRSVRYVRVLAKNIGALPDWHPGAGGPPWLFADEIQVNPHFGKGKRDLREAIHSLPNDSYRTQDVNVTIQSDTATVSSADVSAEFFPTFRVNSAIGRFFHTQEFQPENSKVVVLAFSFWRQQFDGNPSVIGQTLELGGESFTILGVMPSDFDFPTGVGLWMPMSK